MESQSDLNSDDAGSAAASLRSWLPGECSQSDTEEGGGIAMAHLQRLRWSRADSSDFRGQPPSARCGHTAVCVGQSKVVFFGGYADQRCVNDIFVYDIESRLWFTPECIGSGSDRQAGPCPRAFHVAVTIKSTMFIYGGRTESNSLGDLWVLDTSKAIWKWSELNSSGDLPCPREFSAAAVIRNNKILIYGGCDDRKNCLSDLYLLDTRSLEWKKITVAGVVPPPRFGHSFTVIDKMLVTFGGRGVNKSILGDLWALNGINEEVAGEREHTWTELRFPGPSMHALCGHSLTSSRHHLLLFGGYGIEGWHDECIILHRGTQWTPLQTSNEPPPPRSYHSMTCIGPRFLLFGGFDGKSMLGDVWWLVIEGDPNIELDTNDYAELSALKEILGADMDSISVYGSCNLRIDSYIYKHFQQILLMAWFSWRNRPFHDMHILPPPRRQLQGDCAYHSTNTVIECHFKMECASRPPGQVREFHVRLSHHHLKKMVSDYLSSEEGKNARLSDKLAICLLMAKRHGIVSEEDWHAGCPPEAVRYKIKGFRELSAVEKKEIPELLEEGEAILTSFKVTSEYLDLLPHDIYRYRAPDSRNGVTDLHQAHCVVLTSPGYEFKEPDASDAEDLEQCAEIEPPETFFEYINSYTSGWGVDGSGFIYEESLRKTYRIKLT